jgi:hypothetical protein
MKSRKDLSSPREGMNRDIHESELTRTQYAFALNANYQDEHGNGAVMLQNEPSNLLCTTFKPGFKVVGFRYDVNSDNTYFFLTNPTTNVSEIGYIHHSFAPTSIEALENNCECNVSAILEQPLELSTQTATCVYNTLLTDETCPGKLNFNINHPIYENNIQIKNERLGKSIYWTDGFNPPRYVNLNTEGTQAHVKYTKEWDYLACKYTDVDRACIDVEPMRIFPLYNKPCVGGLEIIAGANLKAGLYQTVIAYCNSNGDELSQYYLANLPVSIYDKNNNILDRSNLDYITNQGYSFTISNLDSAYEFFKVVIIHTSGLHGEVSYYTYNIYTTDVTTVTVTNLSGKPTTSLSNLNIIPPSVLTTEGMTNSNGYLIQSGVKERRDINLQPVVNLMGAFAKWSTQQSKENLYERGDSTAKYKGYMRDEVYPFAIKFIMKGGYETSLFPLVPRPATDHELEDITSENDINVESVLTFNPECSTNERKYRWQFENTATAGIDFDCEQEPGTTVHTTIKSGIDASCSINPNLGLTDKGDWNALTNTPNLTTGLGTEGDFYKVSVAGTQTFGAGAITFNIGDYVVYHTGDWIKEEDGVTAQVTGSHSLVYVSDNDFLTYLNTNIDYYKNYVAGTDPDTTTDATNLVIKAAIASAISNTTPCTPTFEGLPTIPATTPTLLATTANAISAHVPTAPVKTVVPYTSSKYVHVKAPATCNAISTDPSTGDPAIDTDILKYIAPNGVVYKRLPVSNLTPDSAKTLTYLADPQVDSPRYLPQSKKTVSSDIASLYGTIVANNVGSSPAYQSYIHNNAIWFSVDVPAGTVNTEVELSKIICANSDANTGTSYRVSIYDGNPLGTTNAPYEYHKITDFTTYTHLTLDPAHYPSGTAYIAIDSAIALTGISSSAYQCTKNTGDRGYINIGLSNYEFTVDSGGADQTVKNIIETYGAELLASHGVRVERVSTNNMVFYYPTSSGFNLSNHGGEDAFHYIPDTGTVTTYNYYSLQPPCGCFNIFKMRPLYEQSLTFDSLKLGTIHTYSTSRRYLTPVLGNCDVAPHKIGKFAYWESTEKYPCNSEMYDSSKLQITASQLSELSTAEKLEFKTMFTNGTDPVGGYYVLDTATTDLVSKPIKHYKFPDNKLVPFMSTKENAPGDFKNSIIYPIGFHLDVKFINTFLDIALANGLISAEERGLISQYEIYRGDRRVSRSVVAKGLLFDMLSENESGTQLYSNYPLNALGSDNRNNMSDSNWYGSRGNINYSFYSPETLFNNPTLPKELSVEGEMYGKTKTHFDTVDRHPTYTILSQGSYTLATVLAGAEVLLETLAKAGDWLTLGFTGDYVTATGGEIIAGVQLALYTAQQFFQVGVKRLQWIQTLYNLGHPTNHAYYQVAVGHYNMFQPLATTSDSKLRGLTISHYLREGLWNVSDEFTNSTLKVNNRDRENQVFLSLSDPSYKLNYTSTYYNYDNTNVNPTKASRTGYLGVGKSPEINSNTAALYATLKQYTPGQYGDISSISWLNTGHCGRLDASATDCKTIFGGDTFVSRFAIKRKFPFFTTTAFGLPPLTPFVYSHYFNIDPSSSIDSGAKLYLNYKMVDETTDDVGVGGLFFPSQRSQYRLEGEQSGTHLYVNPEAKFYLYSYGFPYFLVESEYNCNYRYAGINKDENFYPNTGDVLAFTQEKNVSITAQESFNYNPIYSNSILPSFKTVLPDNYNRIDYDKTASMPNSILVSRKDNSEGNNIYVDPWLVYTQTDKNGNLAVSQSTFPTNFGQLKSLKAIESSIVLVRFTNTVTTFQTAESNIFDELSAAQTKSFNKTDLGYAGTQHQAMLSTEFGHVWVDSQRGKVFTIQVGAGGIIEISKGMEKWFKENLPMILPTYFDINPDNAYNGVGIHMGWDDRLKRIFITKKDFKPKQGLPITLLYTEELGFHYIVTGVTHLVALGDPTYFEDCSWTVAFNHVTDAWISYYSFKPNYYISQNDYFQTGINYSMDSTELGLWSHYSFLSSYQVFYGKLYPFLIEYAVPTKYSDSIFETVTYMLDVRKYYNKYDFANIYGIGFNKAVVYNNQQNTGLLELHAQKENDISQAIEYPKFNNNSISILQSCINNKWSFNYLYNLIKNENSGLPLWIYDAAKVDKTLNNKLLDYRSNYKDRLRGNYFKVQLVNDLESRFKFILQYSLDDRNFYDQ